MDPIFRKIIRLAHQNPELRAELLPMLKQGMEFASPEALKKYLDEHPDADKSKHTVKKTDKKEEGGSGKSVDHTEHLKGISPAHRKYVDDMPAKPMDKEEGYSHPKVKAAIKALKKLPFGSVEKMYNDLEDKQTALGKALVDARVDGKPEEEREALRAAYGQVQQAWRASNQALAEMRWDKEDRDKGGVQHKYLPRAELKKRRQVPTSFKDRLQKWEGSGKSDPIYKVLDEMKVHTYVPHEKLDKAIAHLTTLAEDPHHEDDKKDILKLRDDLAKETGRLVGKPGKEAALRSALIRLAHQNPELRARLLPLLD